MNSILIRENVDIYIFPRINKIHRNNAFTQLTIGDLHANAIKLLFFLLKQGVITHITEKDYINLVNIYRKNVYDLKKRDLVLFDKIIGKIKCNKIGKLRLLGDESADRGSNDYFIFKILEALHKQAVPVEILLSNHGIEFIEGYETRRYMPSRIPSRPPYFQSISMVNLEILIQKGLIVREEILNIYTKVYKTSLKAMSYGLTEDIKSEITLYSHAPIGLGTVKNLANLFKISFKSRTARQLAETIDKINSKFQESVMANTVHKLFKWGMHDDPFLCLTWNRDYDFLERPLKKEDFALNYVHGHDSNEPSQGNIVNLDNDLGKGEQANKDEYTALYSHEIQLADLTELIPSPKINYLNKVKEIGYCRKPPFLLFTNKASIANRDERAVEARDALLKREYFNDSIASSLLIGLFLGVLLWRCIALLGKLLKNLENRGEDLSNFKPPINISVNEASPTLKLFSMKKNRAKCLEAGDNNAKERSLVNR